MKTINIASVSVSSTLVIKDINISQENKQPSLAISLMAFGISTFWGLKYAQSRIEKIDETKNTMNNN